MFTRKRVTSDTQSEFNRAYIEALNTTIHSKQRRSRIPVSVRQQNKMADNNDTTPEANETQDFEDITQPNSNPVPIATDKTQQQGQGRPQVQIRHFYVPANLVPNLTGREHTQLNTWVTNLVQQYRYPLPAPNHNSIYEATPPSVFSNHAHMDEEDNQH
jgi:hypothetical protein